MSSFWTLFFTISITSTIGILLSNLIISASNANESSREEVRPLWWLLTVLNFLLGFVVIMAFSILGGVTAVINIQKHINEKLPKSVIR